MTTPVTAATLPVAEPASPTDTPPPDLFAALLAGTLLPPQPLPGTPEPPTDDAAVDATAPAAWTAATTTLPLAATTVPGAPSAQAGHPTHPVHPVHPVHPAHPVHPVHPVHPAAAADEPPVPTATAVATDPTALPTATTTAPASEPTEPGDPLLLLDRPAGPDAAAPSATPQGSAVHEAKAHDSRPQPHEEPAPVVAAQPPVATAPVVPARQDGPVEKASPTEGVRPAVAAAARRLHREGDVQTLVVRLDPPELGAVLVRMTVREGQVEVTLRAPDAAARGDLLAQAPEIAQVVRDAGLDLSSFDVNLSDAWTGADRQPQQQQESTDRGTPRHSGRADGTGTTVTDDVLDPAAPQPAGTWL